MLANKASLILVFASFFLFFNCSESQQDSESDNANSLTLDQDNANSLTLDQSNDQDQSPNGTSGSNPQNSGGTTRTPIGGGGTSFATYPLPTSIMDSATDLSSLTLDNGETGNATVGIFSTTDYPLSLYIYINHYTLETQIDGVAQPTQTITVNKYFPKQSYIDSTENKAKRSYTGDISNGKNQRLFHFQCDLNSGKLYKVKITLDYMRITSDGYGNETKVNRINYSTEISYRCDGNRQSESYSAINL